MAFHFCLPSCVLVLMEVVSIFVCGETIDIILSPLRTRAPGLQHNLDTAIFLMFENVVGVWCFFQTQPVCNHEGGIDLISFDSLKQRAQVLLNMCLTHLER